MFKRKVPSLGVAPAKHQRNAFDLSERSLYTQPAGMLLPVFVKDMNPDEKINLDIASQLQAQTLRGRAFVGMQQQFAAYFVPYRYLFSYWDSFISGLSVNNTVSSSKLQVSAAQNFSVPVFKPFSLTGWSTSDAVGFDPYLSYIRLCDMLGYGFVAQKGTSAINVDAKVKTFEANAFRWLAYQKIYQDHFLDDRFESRNPSAYNADYYFNAQSGTCVIDSTEPFMVRYAKYNKDFLNNIMPSPMFVTNVSNIIQKFVGTDVSYDTSDTYIHFDVSSSSGITSAASLRNLFALDRMAQISGRATKTYRAQMLAHYGVNVDGDASVSHYCGGFSRDLDTQAVIATSTGFDDGSGPVSFGQQGSFIDNVSNGHIEYSTKDFGVFMVLSWISPSPRWDAKGIDPFNCKLKFADYYHPEFEDLGLQPLYDNYLCNSRITGTGVFGNKTLTQSQLEAKLTLGVSGMNVYGWTPRYSEYKSSFDKLHGEFAVSPLSSTSLRGVPHGSLSFLTTHSPFHLLSKGGFGDGTVEERLSNSFVLSLKDVSISPSVTDDVVEVKYDGNQYTDPFRVETMFSCSMLRNMSVNGLPVV